MQAGAEKALSNIIRQSVKTDKSAWFDDTLVDGDWARIRKLRKGHSPNQGRLKHMTGNLVDSDARAKTLAKYYNKVQWAVRPTRLAAHLEEIGPVLPVYTGLVSEPEEAQSTQVPGEFWKLICIPGKRACKWALDLYQRCWSDAMVPDSWHESQGTAICKNKHPPGQRITRSRQVNWLVLPSPRFCKGKQQ